MTLVSLLLWVHQGRVFYLTQSIPGSLSGGGERPGIPPQQTLDGHSRRIGRLRRLRLDPQDPGKPH